VRIGIFGRFDQDGGNFATVDVEVLKRGAGNVLYIGIRLGDLRR
jgi:hypothetical protein